MSFLWLKKFNADSIYNDIFVRKISSSATAFKTRHRFRLEINAAFRTAVTSLEPNIHKYLSNKQEQLSQ